MKDRIIFRKNFVMLFIICGIMAIVEESAFSYLAFHTDVFVEDTRMLVYIVITCAMISALLCITWLLFRQYLIVTEQAVTYCTLFKRKQTIYCKDATVATMLVQTQHGSQRIVTVTDGTNKIEFPLINGKSMQMLQDLCKTAREKYNTGNLTI